MAKDFTISIYMSLLDALIENGFSFQTFLGFVQKPEEKVIILRHDVDDRNRQSLQFARIQYKLGITGTYYFRIIPQSFDENIIREIESMGHEIGYHCEDLDFARGDVDRAYELAKIHLARLRDVAEVKTMCMHGSPRSPFDNKMVWKTYDYRKLGILAEPYLDVDFSKVLYMTDTGRRWDGDKVSIRDRAEIDDQRETNGTFLNTLHHSEPGIKVKRSVLRHDYRTTFDIIDAIHNGTLRNQVMLNIHPQRWTDNLYYWSRELVTQKTKNIVKRALIAFRNR